MFEVITEALRSGWPDTEFIDPSEFGDIHSAEFEEGDALEGLIQRLHELGATGAVVGVGA